jgi:hypothetical protein
MVMVTAHLQVLHEELEHEAQPAPDDLIRLPPPPMPKPEMSLRTSALPHASQRASLSRPSRMSASNLRPQVLQENS